MDGHLAPLPHAPPPPPPQTASPVAVVALVAERAPAGRPLWPLVAPAPAAPAPLVVAPLVLGARLGLVGPARAVVGLGPAAAAAETQVAGLLSDGGGPDDDDVDGGGGDLGPRADVGCRGATAAAAPAARGLYDPAAAAPRPRLSEPRRRAGERGGDGARPSRRRRAGAAAAGAWAGGGARGGRARGGAAWGGAGARGAGTGPRGGATRGPGPAGASCTHPLPAPARADPRAATAGGPPETGRPWVAWRSLRGPRREFPFAFGSTAAASVRTGRRVAPRLPRLPLARSARDGPEEPQVPRLP